MDKNDLAEVHVPLWKVLLIYGLAFLPAAVLLGIVIYIEATH